MNKDNDDVTILYIPVGVLVKGLADHNEGKVDAPLITYTYEGQPVAVHVVVTERPWEPLPLDMDIFPTLGQVLDNLTESLLKLEENEDQVFTTGALADGDIIYDYEISLSKNDEGETIDDADGEEKLTDEIMPKYLH